MAAIACAAAFAVMSAALAAQNAPPVVRISADAVEASPETLVAAVSRADVVFVGEDHGDRETHRVERWLFDTVSKVRGDVTLALEMFGRDVQEPLEHFQMGHLDDAELVAEARPWPDYVTAYKPLLDIAVGAKWPIVAASAPRAIVDAAAASGPDAVKSRGAGDASLFARDVACPTSGEQFERFRRLTGTPATPSVTPAADARSLDRAYFAECLKEETMAESIANAYAVAAIGGKSPLVISLNGRFHIEYGQGVVERTQRRMPGRTVVTVAIVPVATLESLPANDGRRADFTVFVRR
jgi:uncharacterized iron-regulated protein